MSEQFKKVPPEQKQEKNFIPVERDKKFTEEELKRLADAVNAALNKESGGKKLTEEEFQQLFDHMKEKKDKVEY